MADAAVELLQIHLPPSRQITFARHLFAWLQPEERSSDPSEFTESRARALLRAMSLTDPATLQDFERLTESETAVRLALHDLLTSSQLAAEEAVLGLAKGTPARDESNEPLPWTALALAAFAWKTQYPLHQLDPASPPDSYSPAGQVCRQAAQFLRRQIQRSATERDRLARKVMYQGEADLAPPHTADSPIAPIPPYYRSPIPVTYPEYSRQTVQVNPDEVVPPETAVTHNTPLTITPADLPGEPTSQPTRMPPIRIDAADVPPRRPAPSPRRPVSTPPNDAASRSGFTDAVRSMLGRDKEPLTTTKLRVIVQEYPDGPGLYGLQIHVRCKGIKSFVAGTTNRDGHFLCELPVRVHSGLTYDIDVTWPRDFENNVERKSITLNADRTEFTLPFYSRYNSTQSA